MFITKKYELTHIDKVNIKNTVINLITLISLFQ